MLIKKEEPKLITKHYLVNKRTYNYLMWKDKTSNLKYQKDYEDLKAILLYNDNKLYPNLKEPLIIMSELYIRIINIDCLLLILKGVNFKNKQKNEILIKELENTKSILIEEYEENGGIYGKISNRLLLGTIKVLHVDNVSPNITNDEIINIYHQSAIQFLGIEEDFIKVEQRAKLGSMIFFKKIRSKKIKKEFNEKINFFEDFLGDFEEEVKEEEEKFSKEAYKNNKIIEFSL
jgi:hypothetical protein